MQARPETVRSRQSRNTMTQTVVSDLGKPITEGTAIGSDAATAVVRVIKDLADISDMKPGEILVADMVRTGSHCPRRLENLLALLCDFLFPSLTTVFHC